MTSLRIAFIDHYDSFSWNVIDWLYGDRRPVDVWRLACDDIRGLQELRIRPMPVVFSPGPKHPLDAKPSLEIWQNLQGIVPILGICLGHQLMGLASGYVVTHAANPRHGSVRTIEVIDNKGIFSGLPAHFRAAAYNSLAVVGDAAQTLARVSARCEQGEVQALENWSSPLAPCMGVQFHPESFLSEQSEILLRNWLDIVERWYETRLTKR